MKKLRDTRTGNGTYYQMTDGRIGYVTEHYARISTHRIGFRNGELFVEDSKIGDRVYQINKTLKYTHPKYGHEAVMRVRYNNKREAYLALVEYDLKNCQLENKIKNIIKTVNYRKESMEYAIQNEWNNGYNTGVKEVKENVEYYMNKILNTI